MALSAIAVFVGASRLSLPDLPPLAHTGGFGEPTCRQCHVGNPFNEPAGRLTVTGLPDRVARDRAYELIVQLVRPGMARAGFELSVRRAGAADSGRQAGQLEPIGDGIEVTDTTLAAFGVVQYARQRHDGSNLAGRDTARWTLQWKAPANLAGAVVLHVAANAANDDDSPLGDFIYTDSALTRSAFLRP